MTAEMEQEKELTPLVKRLWPEHPAEELTNTASLRFHLSIGFEEGTHFADNISNFSSLVHWDWQHIKI